MMMGFVTCRRMDGDGGHQVTQNEPRVGCLLSHEKSREQKEGKGKESRDL